MNSSRHHPSAQIRKTFSLLKTSAGLLLAGSLIIQPLCAAPFPADAIFTAAQKQQQRDAGATLLNNIYKAKFTDKASSYSIPAGNYRFSSTSTQGSRQVFIKFVDYDNFTIYGNNSTFYFENDRLGFYIGSCSNFKMQEINIDYDPLPFTQGVVKWIDSTGKKVGVQLEAGYEKVTPRFASLSSTTSNPEIRGAIIASDGRFKRKQNLFRVMPFFSTPKNSDGTYTVNVLPFYGEPLSSINVAINDRIALGIRGDGAVLVEGCDHCVLTNIDMYASPGLCFTDAGGYGQNTYRDCNIVQRWTTNRLISGNADGFNSVNTETGPLIESANVSSLLDDGVNVHGVYSRVLRWENARSIVVDQIAWRGTVDSAEFQFVNAGDSAPLGRFTGKATRIDYDDPAVSGTATVPAHRLTFTVDVQNVQRDDLVACLKFIGKGATVRNNEFKNILTRGILFRSSNGSVTGNTISWTGLYGIALMPQPGVWSEASYCESVNTSWNILSDTYVFENADNENRTIAGIYAYAPGYTLGARQKELTFNDNKIYRTAGHGIHLAGVSTATLWTNYIEDYGSGIGGNGIRLINVTGLSTGDNTYRNLGSPGGSNYLSTP